MQVNPSGWTFLGVIIVLASLLVILSNNRTRRKRASSASNYPGYLAFTVGWILILGTI